MIYSYNFLQSFFAAPLPKPEVLADLLMMHSFEVEGIKKQGKDAIFDIAVLSNRGHDCFSHLGMAREISALLNRRIKTEKLIAGPRDNEAKQKKMKSSSSIKEDKNFDAKDFIKIKIEEQKDWQRYSSRVILGVKIGKSPKWMQERLISCGLRPINNIVDILNYAMLEIGQPLHAFDLEKIEGKTIIVRRAKNGEKILTLDGKKYELNEKVLVLADQKDLLGIAGIKGGKKAEINFQTKDIVLESANFSSGLIRSTSRSLNLKTDASIRFEYGLDPNLTQPALERVSYLIQKFASGRIAKGLIDFYPKPVLPQKIAFNLNRIKEVLGIEIDKKKVVAILNNLGFEIKKSKKNELLIIIPTFRSDVEREEDLIEEIGRIYGYEKIIQRFPTVELVSPKENLNNFFQEKTKDILVELGFSEVYNYSFIGEQDQNIFKFKKIFELENPTSAEFKYLRPSLIPNLLKNIRQNLKFFEDIKIFELGKVFNINEEKKALAMAIPGDSFFYLKGIIKVLFEKLNINNAEFEAYEKNSEEAENVIFVSRHSAKITINKETIGTIGEIDTELLASYDIAKKVFIVHFDFERILKFASLEKEYQAISPYPSLKRDIAVLVDDKIPVLQVIKIIKETGGKLLTEIELFDIFKGNTFGENKKNLAFHLVFQRQDGNLSSADIDIIFKQIIAKLENKNWQVRM